MPDNRFSPATPKVALPVRIGAALYLLWSVLHIWVGVEGLHQYLGGDVAAQWNMLIGGSRVPLATFVHTTDAVTAFAHGQLIVNFAVDVGGYGVLGLFVAWMLWTRASWLAYFMGLLLIGIADLAFLFAMVMSGVIALNAGTIGGPVLWFLAVVITPFGMPSLRRKA